ncbi:RNA polymerase sigma factor [Patulibacter sp. NPDC049589]|uniref:RNA polymerase sigma factor n=1 Tax=Patulibacter sp. NPDC049589 TaxID=3154731 RepID=UPI00341617E3
MRVRPRPPAPARGTDRDEALLRSAASGDDLAFAVFYRRHADGVTGFHLRRTGRPELAFDLTAETFAAVVVGLRRFDPAKGPATGWLYGIAANKLLESLRRGRVEDRARRELRLDPVVLEDAGFARVEDRASAADEDALRLALQALPEDQRAAVLARVVDERPYDEIARELSCSTSVVRQRVHRGLRQMRTQMEDRA